MERKRFGAVRLLMSLFSGLATMAAVTAVGAIVTFSAIRSSTGSSYAAEISFSEIDGCLATVVDGQVRRFVAGDVAFCRTGDGYPEDTLERVRAEMQASWAACGDRFPAISAIPVDVRKKLQIALCGREPLTIAMKLP